MEQWLWPTLMASRITARFLPRKHVQDAYWERVADRDLDLVLARLFFLSSWLFLHCNVGILEENPTIRC